MNVIKNFKLKEVWSLLRWIFFYEVILFVIVITLNIFVDVEKFYLSISPTGFISFGIFSLFFIFIVEILGLTQIYLYWYKKFGLVRISNKEIIKKLLTIGEGKKIEFKISLRWDYDKNEFNKELEKSVIKTIAGFMNSDGGSLIIGVSDKKEIAGLEKDFQTLPKKDKDGLENYLTQIIRVHVGSSNLRLINIGFENIDGKTVCYVIVKMSEDPVFTKLNGSEEFFVRVGNSTASLSISESLNYIKNHWQTDIDNPKSSP